MALLCSVPQSQHTSVQHLFVRHVNLQLINMLASLQCSLYYRARSNVFSILLARFLLLELIQIFRKLLAGQLKSFSLHRPNFYCWLVSSWLDEKYCGNRFSFISLTSFNCNIQHHVSISVSSVSTLLELFYEVLMFGRQPYH